MFKFDIHNNLVTISNSILYYFTGKSFHETNKNLDYYLSSKKYKKITVFLFDGFGKSIREKTLKESDFLRKKTKFTISSIFPPTTVAATTAFNTCKYPVETGWLGWQQYFKNEDLVVEMFTNKDIVSENYLPGEHLAEKYVPTKKIWDYINEESDARAIGFFPQPIDPKGPNNLNDFFQKVSSLMKYDGKQYIYAYWASPDNLIHEHGTDSIQVRNNCKLINKYMAKIAKENKDNLIIVLADHSLVNVNFFYTGEHEDFADCLKNVISLDSRSIFFHVKDDKKDEFVKLFNQYYGEYFVLKTKEEVIKEKWFGEGEENQYFRDFLGDFMATSISKYAFTHTTEKSMKGAHSGSVEEESLIDVSILNI